MKKILMLLVLLSSVMPAWAATDNTAASSTTANPRYAGIGVGVDQPLTNWNTGYALGFGGNLFGGYAIEGPWAVQVNIDPFLYSSNGYTLTNLRFLAEAKYTFAGQGWQPYVLAGPGAVFQSLSPGTFSTVNFAAVAGLGAQFDLGGQLHFFVQAEDHFILPSGPAQMDLPITAGIWTGL
jgi:opacity protein-like surface antigen